MLKNMYFYIYLSWRIVPECENDKQRE